MTEQKGETDKNTIIVGDLNTPLTAIERLSKQKINTDILVLPWLVWLRGLSASLQTKGLPVQFPVRAHAWVVG